MERVNISHSGPVVVHGDIIHSTHDSTSTFSLPLLSSLSHVLRTRKNEVASEYHQEQEDQHTNFCQDHRPPVICDPANGTLKEGRVKDGIGNSPQCPITVYYATVVEEITIASEITARETNIDDSAMPTR